MHFFFTNVFCVFFAAVTCKCPRTLDFGLLCLRIKFLGLLLMDSSSIGMLFKGMSTIPRKSSLVIRFSSKTSKTWRKNQVSFLNSGERINNFWQLQKHSFLNLSCWQVVVVQLLRCYEKLKNTNTERWSLYSLVVVKSVWIVNNLFSFLIVNL